VEGDESENYLKHFATAPQSRQLLANPRVMNAAAAARKGLPRNLDSRPTPVAPITGADISF